MVKKIAFSAAAAVSASFGASAEVHEAVQVSAAAVTIEKPELETHLPDTIATLTVTQAQADDLSSANNER
ncbi:hypothetical protein ACPROK_16385 [Glutamicibacter soli]|uniref:hypothetical protein n=1 Tax=Micrococcaceae TaxID=1268 RepID=UPI000AE8B10D|nr:hypothetical protein [Arthrobacter sp. YC-RL1]